MIIIITQLKLKNFIKKKLGHYTIIKSNVIVVIGRSLKKYHKYNKKWN